MCTPVFCMDLCFAWICVPSSLWRMFRMISLRMVALAGVAFVVSSFGSLATAGCHGGSSCGGRTGLLARLHAKKECSGGGLLAKLHARKAASCSAAPAPSCAPAPAPSCGCEATPVASGCGCSGSTVYGSSVISDGGVTGTVIVGSAPCTNCGTTLDSGVVTSGSAVPPAPAGVAPAAPAAGVAPAAGAAPATPAVPATPEAPAVPAVPGSASDVPKA